MPPKDPKVIESTFRLARYFIVNAQNLYPALYLAFRELIASNDEKKLATKLVNFKLKKSEIKDSGLTEEGLREIISKVREEFRDSENVDKKQVRELQSSLETKEQEFMRVQSEQLFNMNSIRESSLLEGQSLGRGELFSELKSISQGVLDTKQGVSQVSSQIQDFSSVINNLLRTSYDGQYSDRKIQRISISDTERGLPVEQEDSVDRKGVRGLGLSQLQRKEFKKIIAKTAGKKYAEAFNLISGENIEVESIVTGLAGIALSMVLPIPSFVFERLANVYRQNFNSELSAQFDDIKVPDTGEIILLTSPEKLQSAQEFIAGMDEERQKLGEEHRVVQTKKRKNKKTNPTLVGGIIGGVVGGIGSLITGSSTPYTDILNAGAIGTSVSTITQAVSQSQLPRIASEIGNRIIQATPQLPIPEAVVDMRDRISNIVDMPLMDPVEKEEKKFSKEKSLALIGSAIALPSAVALQPTIKKFWKEEPIDLPQDVLTEQQDTKAKGMLRPKFIIPSVDILQPSEQELAADALEYSSFDFVKPGSEGGNGDLKTNVLKRIQQENDNIRFRGAGIDIMPFGQQFGVPSYRQEQDIVKLFLSKLPPMKFKEQDFNLSEFEARTFDPTNMRTAFEIFSPYDDFSDTIPEEMSESMLFSIVP